MRKFILLSLFIITLCGCGGSLCGCGGGEQQRGFLSDYTRLKQTSSTSFRYAAKPEMLGEYSKFIIDPVQVRFYTDEDIALANISQQDLTKLQNYMRQSIIQALSDRYEIVYQSGYGVGRIRTALTDLKKTKAFSDMSQEARIAGTGAGSVSMEAEIIDSQTGKQIRAYVETQPGSRLSFEGLNRWEDAKTVIDAWSKELRRRIDEAHRTY